MKRHLAKIALIALALAAFGLLVAASGVIPIRASSGHWAVTEWFLQFAKHRSIATHSLGTDVPKLDDPNLVLKGAGHYDFGCRSCHGSPGEPLPRIAQAMLPVPPDLTPRVRERTAAQLFEIVKHGLKFTGMPAWPAPHRDDEVWAVVAFLQKLPELDREGYRRLVNREPVETTPIELLTPTAASPATLRTCAPCHGRDGGGRGSTVFPRLAAQRRDYLENALLAYANGDRPSGIMAPIAAGLDPATMRALADHYAQLPPAAAPPPERDEADLELGRKIALEGIPARRVPACVECHGPRGRRTKSAYPDLAGQPADYLVLQLELFKKDHRGGSPYAHLMQEVAPKLEANEMHAVARYFESLAPDR